MNKNEYKIHAKYIFSPSSLSFFFFFYPLSVGTAVNDARRDLCFGLADMYTCFPLVSFPLTSSLSFLASSLLIIIVIVIIIVIIIIVIFFSTLIIIKQWA